MNDKYKAELTKVKKRLQTKLAQFKPVKTSVGTLPPEDAPRTSNAPRLPKA